MRPVGHSIPFPTKILLAKHPKYQRRPFVSFQIHPLKIQNAPKSQDEYFWRHSHSEKRRKLYLLPFFSSLFLFVRFSDRFTHRRIGLYIFHLIIIHNTEISRTESLSHRFRYFRFRFDHFCSCFLSLSHHLLF